MSIITESYDQTARRLQLLGIPPEVIDPLIQYVEALNTAQHTLATTQYSHMLGTFDQHLDERGRELTDLNEWFDIDPEATSAGKYVQIVRRTNRRNGPASTDGVERSDSVHSVVIKATGEVCKSGGWKKGPAKSTSKARKGQPLVAYTLTDLDSFRGLLQHLDTYGSYLYSR